MPTAGRRQHRKWLPGEECTREPLVLSGKPAQRTGKVMKKCSAKRKQPRSRRSAKGDRHAGEQTEKAERLLAGSGSYRIGWYAPALQFG
jgi:hypothetical protein